MRVFHVYIVARDKESPLYTGLTSGLARRAFEHRETLLDGYTAANNLKKLVYYEEHASFETAFQREKLFKKWRRQWKVNLVEKMNPDWRDLYLDLNK